MLALYPTADEAAALAALTPSTGEAVETLHVTLAYLGPADELSQAQRDLFAAALAVTCAGEQPLTGTISGLGHFDAAADNNDGLVPCVALVDAPGIGSLRVALMEAMGLDPDGGEHDLSPHVSLAFHAPGACSTGNPANLSVSFGSVRLVAADEVLADVPLSGQGGQMSDIPVIPTDVGRWQAPDSILEGVKTGDGRIIDPGALTWRDLPLTLGWAIQDEGGHDGCVSAGSVDIIRRGGTSIFAGGVFDSGSDGQELRRMIGEGTVNGISADLDDVTVLYEPDIESIVTPDEAPGVSGEIDVLYLERCTSGRICGYTAVRIPAFEEARITLAASADVPGRWTITVPVVWALDDDGALVASVAPHALEAEREPVAVVAAADGVVKTPIVVPLGQSASLTAHAHHFATDGSVDLLHPPAEWFRNPMLTEPTPLTVTADGRVFGHLAQFGVAHRGIDGKQVYAESTSRDMGDFLQGRVTTAEGAVVSVGVVTVGGPHADLGLSPEEARAHYAAIGDQYECSDNAAACVAAGWDEIGIWLAGAVAPSATVDQVWRLRTMTQSGDWRGRDLKLCASLTVPVGGFPKFGRLLVASGEPLALVAAGMIERPPFTGVEALIASLLDRVDELAGDVTMMRADRLMDQVGELFASAT